MHKYQYWVSNKSLASAPGNMTVQIGGTAPIFV
jgi:hypothetical protein